MGNALATRVGHRGRGPHARAASRKGRAGQQQGPEGPSSTGWARQGRGAGSPIGTLVFSPDSVSWSAAAADVLAVLSAKGCCVSPSFSVPARSLPPGCKHLLGCHKWQLCWEAAEYGDSSAQSLFLGCPSLANDSAAAQPWAPGGALGICCEVSLEVRCVLGREGGGTSTCFHRREWLSHAFSRAEPDWGLWGVLLGPEALGGGGGAVDRVWVEVEVRFLSMLAHLQGQLPGQLQGVVLQELAYRPPLLQISEEPYIIALEGFLSGEECQAVKDLAGPYLKRSKVSAGDETPLRTSSGMFLTGALGQHPVAAALDARVQQLADLACRLEGRRPLVLSEATQVVRYQEGEYYAEHYDNKAGTSSKRVATVMVYLSDVAEGGATYYPRSPGLPLQRALESCAAGSSNHPAAPPAPASPASVLAGAASGEEGGEGGEGGTETPGLRIYSRRGRAIIFWSQLPNGREDKASIHAAERVGRGGEKWIATRWCREA